MSYTLALTLLLALVSHAFGKAFEAQYKTTPSGVDKSKCSLSTLYIYLSIPYPKPYPYFPPPVACITDEPALPVCLC